MRVLGTGDFTHPAWFDNLKKSLVPAEPGLYVLKDPPQVAGFKEPTRFLMQVEVSLVYKHLGATRRVHHLIYMPSLEAAEELNTRLGWEGNIESDGRPTFGMSSERLAEIVYEVSQQAVIVPAHCWTPWYAIFGSKSGYDSVEECFGRYADKIFALETGLSSDLEMNRRISRLDKYTFISGSDAHSPERIGREATVFNTELSYQGIMEAIKKGTRDVLPYTIEFYPDEGRYHYDGHRSCGVRFSPEQTKQAAGLCPKCGQPLTKGVLHRVDSLADRDQPKFPPDHPGFKHLVQLDKIIGEALGVGAGSKKVLSLYNRMIDELGPEFTILESVPIKEIGAVAGERVAEGVRRMRAGELIIEPGYDGKYGIVRIFSQEGSGQAGLNHTQKTLF